MKKGCETEIKNKQTSNTPIKTWTKDVKLKSQRKNATVGKIKNVGLNSELNKEIQNETLRYHDLPIK